MEQLKQVGKGNRNPKNKISDDTVPIYRSELNNTIEKINEIIAGLPLETIYMDSGVKDSSSEVGEHVFSFPSSDYIPSRLIVIVVGTLQDLVGQDGEQTEIFNVASLQEGISLVYPKDNVAKPVLGGLIFTSSSTTPASTVRLILELIKVA